jgi:hypothetical protein
MLSRAALVILVLALPAAVFAEKAVERPVLAQTLGGFEQQAASVRQGMQPGGVYGFISDDDRRHVEQRLDEMHRLLQDHSAQAQLAQTDKVSLLNAQEEVNAILLKNDNNRLICEHGTQMGSRIHVTTCQTYGELMQRQQQDRQMLSNAQRQPQTQRDGL